MLDRAKDKGQATLILLIFNKNNTICYMLSTLLYIMQMKHDTSIYNIQREIEYVVINYVLCHADKLKY